MHIIRKLLQLHMGGTTIGSSGGGGCSFLQRFLFRALLVGLVCVVVVVGSKEATTTTTTREGTTTTLSTHSVEMVRQKHVVIGRDNNNKNNKGVERAELEDFNYNSKRKVPNGPDPIHNRRAGNSGRPPGQA